MRYRPFVGALEKERPRFKPPAMERRELQSEKLDPWPKGVLSLDVTFDADGKPYILELHGSSAGIGLERVNDEEFERPIHRRVREIARIWNRNHKKYINPYWFRNIDADKAVTADEQLIPFENCPRTVTSGNFGYLFARGPVIVKPRASSQGDGIRVFLPTQIEEAHTYAEELRERNGAFIAQELITSRGADQASGDLKGHAASLRLLIPFKRIDGKIKVTIPRFGYQRVSPYDISEVGQRVRGRVITLEDALVVNIGRNAASVPMSDREYDAVLPVALELINRITVYGSTTPEFATDRARLQINEAREIEGSVEGKYPVNVRCGYYSSYDRSKQADRETEVEAAGRALHFVTRLEDQLRLIDPRMWQTKIMRVRNYRPVIERIDGGTRGRIELRNIHYANQKYEFDVDESGSLQRILASFIEENSPLI